MATILIIDDSDSQRGEIRAVLEQEQLFGTILEASDGYQGLKSLLGEPVDVVLCDLELPGLDGAKLLRAKKQKRGAEDVPFLFLTGTTDLDRRARLLDSGACDVIAKPFHPADLVARLRLHLKVQRLQEELRLKNEQLALQSSVDSLTGLKSRRYAFDRLNFEFLRARRYQSPLTVLMCDLDQFKALNDQYGHPGGDAVLIGVAAILLKNLRSTDVAGRYGGEELIVIMQGDVEGAAVVAERWREHVEDARFETPDGRQADVTISIGIAQLSETHESPEDLIGAADERLYVAKAKGRNRVEFGR